MATATEDVERISLTRELPGIGRLDFEQAGNKRDYWFLAEGNTRRARYPSVTSILRDVWPGSESLLHWYAQNGKDAYAIRAEKAMIGKDTHRFLEMFLSEGVLLPFSDFPDNRRPFLQGAARFVVEMQPQVVAVERLVCHPEQRYAGRPDFIGYLSDSSALTLLDYKTQAEGNVYAKAHVQGAGYAIADHRCGGAPIERIAVVGINDQGKYRIVETPLAEAGRAWTDALTYYGSQKALLRALGE